MIGFGALMGEANGLDRGEKAKLRDPMVELIKITEGFFARGVAASVYGLRDELAGNFKPRPVFANIGKLLLATQIYGMHRLAHEVSGGLSVALPGPDEDPDRPLPRRWPKRCAPTPPCRTTSGSRSRASSRTWRRRTRAAGTR